MGTIFEELVRRFNEENNEEAGEHWTPRDAVRLMAKLIFMPIADQIESGTYLLYEGALGTGGMLTVAGVQLINNFKALDLQTALTARTLKLRTLLEPLQTSCISRMIGSTLAA
jgi:type I restriction enzyme M protein